MQIQDSQIAAPERHCILVFLAGIGVMALAVPVVCWSVETAFRLLR